MALETKVQGYEAELNDMKRITSTLQQESQSKDQFHRMNNAEISGIPFIKGENLNNLLFSIASKVGITLNERDIDSFHRVHRFEKKPTFR